MSESTGEPDGARHRDRDDQANDDLRLMTRIDGDEARLLVHIVPIDDADDDPTEASDPGHAPPADPAGLAE